MNDSAASVVTGETVEAVMRVELAHGDALVGTIAPILRHLLANDEHSVFSDEIIARVRGMLSDLAVQLLDAQARASGAPEARDHDSTQIEALDEQIALARQTPTGCHKIVDALIAAQRRLDTVLRGHIRAQPH